MSEQLLSMQKEVQDKVILVQKVKDMQNKLKHIHVKIEFFKVEVRKIEDLKNSIRKKEEDIRRIEKVFNETRMGNVKYEMFIKEKNPIIENRELKKKLEELKNDKELEQNRYLNETKDSLIEEIKILRTQLEANDLKDNINDDNTEEIEIIITTIKSRYYN